MNVDRLMKLAETIEKGYHTFGEHTVALTMGHCLIHTKKVEIFMLPNRDELKDVNYHYLGCLMAFTLLLFGDSQQQRMLWNYEERSSNFDGHGILNVDAEAMNILGLDPEISHALFYGTMSHKTSGKQAARVIRKLLKTGEVDWEMIIMEMYS